MRVPPNATPVRTDKGMDARIRCSSAGHRPVLYHRHAASMAHRTGAAHAERQRWRSRGEAPAPPADLRGSAERYHQPRPHRIFLRHVGPPISDAIGVCARNGLDVDRRLARSSRLAICFVEPQLVEHAPRIGAELQPWLRSPAPFKVYEHLPPSPPNFASASASVIPGDAGAGEGGAARLGCHRSKP